MKSPKASGKDSRKRLHELENAIDQLQEKLDALTDTLKDIKNDLEKGTKKDDGTNSCIKVEGLSFPYLFTS